MDGQDLQHWTQANKPPVERIVRLMIEITQAIGFAHQQALVHRDLKPGNILIDREGHAHVGDFGLPEEDDVEAAGADSGVPALAVAKVDDGKSSAASLSHPTH